MTDKPEVTIYVDGACEPNPGVGGWGVVMLYGSVTKIASGRVERATNQTMEITAALEALRRLKKPCRVSIVSDSKYLINCATGEWKINANSELWREYFDVAKPHDITYQWVKGHSGNEWNERADELAVEAIYARP